MKFHSSTYFPVFLIAVSQVVKTNGNPTISIQSTNDLNQLKSEPQETRKLKRYYENKGGFRTDGYELEKDIQNECKKCPIISDNRHNKHRISRAVSTDLVDCATDSVTVNVKGFLDLAIFQLEHMLTVNENVTMQMREQLQHHTVEKTERIKNVIKAEITSEINNINVKLEEGMRSMMQKILEIIKSSEGDVQRQIQEEMRNLKNLTYLKRLFALAAALTESINSGFFESSESLTNFDLEMGIQLPIVLKTGTDYAISRAHVLENFLNDLNENEPAFFNLRNVINETRTQLLTDTNIDALGIVEGYLIEVKNNMTRTHEQQAGNSPNENELLAINNLEKKLKVAQLSVNAYNKYLNDSEAIEILYGAAKLSTELEMTEINEKERDVYALCIPSVLVLQKWIKTMLNYEHLISAESVVAVDETKWEVHKVIKYINSKVQDLAQGLSTSGNADTLPLRIAINMLEEAIDTMFNIFYENAIHLEYRRLIGFMGQRNASGDKDIVTVICLHKNALNAYKHLVFPIIDMLEGLDKVDLKTETNPNGNIPQLAARAIWEILAMKTKLPTLNTTISGKYNGSLRREYFNETSKHGPLFTWEFHRDNRLAAKLFEGQEIKVNALATGGLNENAVKFKRLNIRIKEHDPHVQGLIYDALKHYKVKLTHSGHSYYRCGEHVYKTTTCEIPMVFALSKRGTRMPHTYNMVYSKVNTGDLLFSPYTTWTIKLSPFNPDEDFWRLQEFTELEMDIQLEGKAYFLQGSNVCDENLKNFYELVR